MSSAVRPARRAIAALALAAALGGCSLPAGGSRAEEASDPTGRGQAGGERADEGAAMDREAAWNQVESLIDEQKYRAALEVAERLLGELRGGPDEDAWVRALVQVAQLETGLHGFETAVRRLNQEPRPAGPLAGVVLDLYLAHGLAAYLEAYAWEIGQREAVAAAERDLDSWTAEEIMDAARRALGRVWERRVELGAAESASIGRYLESGNYPREVRSTLRDAATYLWLELEADSSRWAPRHELETYLLDVEALLARSDEVSADALVDPALHPVERMVMLLADLETWHRREGRREAAVEARLERLRRLDAAFPARRQRIASELELLTRELDRSLPWWSVAVVELAELTARSDDPWALVEARRLAIEAEAAHPESIGGQRARSLEARLSAPEYSLTAMSTDGLGRRSVRVRHANLERLYFRAYRIDVPARATAGRDFDLLYSHREIDELVASAAPDVEWTTELPPTPDLRPHATHVEPAIDAPGFYLVVASARQDFVAERNRLEAVTVNLSDLVLLSRSTAAAAEVTVRSGRSGRAVAGAEVTLYRYDYRRRRHRRLESVRSDEAGRARFELEPRSGPHFVIARLGADVALDPALQAGVEADPVSQRRSALVYTDRSAYRPRQTVLWKVVGYHRGAAAGEFVTAAGGELTVELVDANGEVVAETGVQLDDFGSTAGSFEVPAGRLLGSWQLRTSWGGGARLLVEEYKRPTFEVTLEPPATALRLNREASIGGEARYYFGRPLVGGTLAWRAVRVPLYPRWWSWWHPMPPAPEVVVASGRGDLDESGRFDVTFVPAADEELAAAGVSFRYRIEIEVTDEGGETRRAERLFRLGFAAIEASIETDGGFLLSGAPASLTVRRSDLDGTPRAGLGEWRLMALAEPPRTPLPAELAAAATPAAAASGSEAYRTPGDDQRARWEGVSDPAAFMRTWASAGEVVRGAAQHGADGLAVVRLPALELGSYRLLYTTSDSFGASFEVAQEVLVVAPEAATEAGTGGSPGPRVPIVLAAESSSVEVGGRARFLVHSGLPDQELELEVFSGDDLVLRRRLESDRGPHVVEVAVEPGHRGGLGARLTGVRDHQLLALETSVAVPWTDRRLEVSFATFRDRLRPGARESWSVVVTGADERALAAGSVELLAYMYDRSLDLFAPHDPQDPLGLYPSWGRPRPVGATLGASHPRWREGRLADLPGYPALWGDRLKFLSGYGIGGMGRRFLMARDVPFEAMAAAPVAARGDAERGEPEPEGAEDQARGGVEEPSSELRSDFSETAFWEPHLRLGPDGVVAFEFTVPDSLTEWSVWVHALSRDLASGRTERRAVSAKELMVRPYLPRFLRQGDRIEIRVAVDNAGERDLAGTFDLALADRDTGADLGSAFGITPEATTGLEFEVAAGDTVILPFTLTVPARLGEITVTASARAGEWSDGEVRPLPVLPGRMHLVQSRFAALSERDRRRLEFAELTGATDPTLLSERLVVSIEGQLFYGVLDALPYLANFPYECTEQLLNRFLSTGIVSTLYDRYPTVARMARQLGERDTRLQPWREDDPNRTMTLEETPWVTESRGSDEDAARLVNVLDPEVAAATRRESLGELRRAQTASGGFPWWPGGPPSPYMTLYLTAGFARALEFGIEVPRPMVARAWRYLHHHYLDEMVERMEEGECCWEMVTFLNYVLSSYPDEAWTGEVFDAADRERMLDFSFRNWRSHPPLLKGYLALTLQRAGRDADARLVFDSVMDSARSEPDLGTFWAPEDRSWLWYNDTIESHAFALRVLAELDPEDERRHGLVQWLFLNKKLNQWKSTRATAEVIYALVHYLERENGLAVREAAEVAIGRRPLATLVFEPEEYSGRGRQIIVPGAELESSDGEIIVGKETPGLLFATATWHYSTERLPAASDGDLFAVERRYFRRSLADDEWVLEPLTSASRVGSGDQVEVELTVRARHAAEYVHLRDPRPAGFEPETLTSGYRWDLGLGRYEEIRDSGTSFFFERLPVGEYTLRYRLRANLAGTFKAAPAVLQSMYAPEFAAHSAGHQLTVGD